MATYKLQDFIKLLHEISDDNFEYVEIEKDEFKESTILVSGREGHEEMSIHPYGSLTERQVPYSCITHTPKDDPNAPYYGAELSRKELETVYVALTAASKYFEDELSSHGKHSQEENLKSEHFLKRIQVLQKKLRPIVKE